ncbi:emp24p/erv25p- protein [Borealophlyctis nickersoniae]|nr:emp24p/erv25p- protein [Borealophlyctis nickersoniae]
MRHQASPVLFLLAILLALPATQALYFYMDRHEQRCFIEELPKETTVVGTYKSEEFNHHTNAYQENPETGIIIGVEVAVDSARL